MSTEPDYKQLAMDSLERTLANIKRSYGVIYDMVEENRDVVFIKEFADIIIQVSALMEVYARDGKVHPGYALDKVTMVKIYAENHAKYWEERLGDIPESSNEINVGYQ